MQALTPGRSWASGTAPRCGSSTAAWVSWLHSQLESVLRRTVLQEVGIAAVSGAYREPAGAAPSGATLDVAIQDKWFAAACAAAKQPRLAGIYFYDVNSTDRPASAVGYDAAPSSAVATTSSRPASLPDGADGAGLATRRVVRCSGRTATARIGPSRDRTTLAVGLVAAVLSTASTYYYFRRHLILGYQDSFSHLEISRRVVAGLSPGIAQLGGIWLPVPQLLQDLFSWNDALYRTGLAGSAVSMVCYVASTVLLYRLIRIYSGERKSPAVAGAMVFATNVDVLYQRRTSMDELPFYAFTIAVVYYLVKWGETRNPTDLLAASIASMLAVLCRYEGWFLAAVYVICVMAIALRSGYSWRDTRGLALASSIFGLLIPTGGWLLYNFMIFNNPLNFENGPDSSAAQMAERHIDINIGNWPLTFNGYGYAVHGSRPRRDHYGSPRAGPLPGRGELFRQVGAGAGPAHHRAILPVDT